MGIDAIPPPASGLPARLVLGPALRAQSDRRLVRLVREGYESAFEEIVRRYRRPLDRFAASIVGGRSEDVTQDSFRKALVALRDGDAEVELRPWLYRIVRNTALNDLRDRPPAAAELAEELVGGGRSAAAEAEQREEVATLVTRLRSLPDRQRAALMMRELEGMGHEEIAAALGISGGAARQAIARARAAVRGGFGALVPLPLVRALAGSDPAVEAAAGGALGSGGAATALLGGGGAVKVGLATAVVAGSLGAGVALHHQATGQHGGDLRAGAATTEIPAPGGPQLLTVESSPSPDLSDVDHAVSEPDRDDDAGDRPRSRRRGSGRRASGRRGERVDSHRSGRTSVDAGPTTDDPDDLHQGGRGHGSDGQSEDDRRRTNEHDGSGSGSGNDVSGSRDGSDPGSASDSEGVSSGHDFDDHGSSSGSGSSGHRSSGKDSNHRGSPSTDHPGSSGPEDATAAPPAAPVEAATSGNPMSSGSTGSGSSGSDSSGSDDSSEAFVVPIEAPSTSSEAPGSVEGDSGSASGGGHGSSGGS